MGGVLAGGLLTSGVAVAQNFPTRQVTMVVPFGPGGGTDTYGRYLSEALSKLWGEAVVIENRPGAGSALGAAYVAKAKPDGYTLLFVSTSYTTSAATQAKLPFDPKKDLTAVAMMGVSDLFVNAGKRVSLTSLADVKGQANAQTIFAATPGLGSLGHLGQLLLMDTMDVKMEFVHHTSGAAVLTDLGGGRVDTAIGVLFEAKSGNGTPIAVMSERRNPALPNVPTVVEAGFPAAQADIWFGVFAPAGTPQDVIEKINGDVVSVMKSQEGAAFLEKQATRPSNETPAQMSKRVNAEIDRWTALAEKHGVRK